MAGGNRSNWDELTISKEEVENLKEALKKEEFRKLLAEYANEVTDPKNRKKFQDDIIQLEAERGIDCTFVNPEPGFVVKTSVDGKKKAFINIAKNEVIGRPTSVPVTKDNTKGLSWSLPFSQSPGREDLDKKHNRCMVYDVIFHPDTLRLADKSPNFKKLVIDSALNAIEENFNVKLDKKNLKFPKLKFKGIPFASVIRKRSEKQPILTEEDIEFQKNINYPMPPPPEGSDKPVIRNYDHIQEDKLRYTFPKYIIKHRTGVDLQEFTYDKNGKINIAIPKQLVIEVNLPLLSSTKTVTLDVTERSVHLLSKRPAKYKLDIQLPYAVKAEQGIAKFDKTARLLIITLPVIKAKTTIRDLMKEFDTPKTIGDSKTSHVESSSSEEECIPVGDDCFDNKAFHTIAECDKSEVGDELVEICEEKNEVNQNFRTKEDNFLDVDKYYVLPPYKCNIDNSKLCFILDVKNVDPNSVVKMKNPNTFHLKFLSLGSGFYPVFYAFLVKFEEDCLIEDVTATAWDNNVTVCLQLNTSKPISTCWIGTDKSSLALTELNDLVSLERKFNEVKLHARLGLDDDEEDLKNVLVKVESADKEEVVIQVLSDGKDNDVNKVMETNSSKESHNSLDKSVDVMQSDADDTVLNLQSTSNERISQSLPEGEHDSTLSFNESDEVSIPGDTTEILDHKEPIGTSDHAENRTHSDSASDESIPQDKNQASVCDKKVEDKLPPPDRPLIEEVEQRKEETCDVKETTTAEKEEDTVNDLRFRAKKDDKIFDFKSELIFDLDS